MRDYLTEIQHTCNSRASCGHPIEEMEHILIILKGVKGQYNAVVYFIHSDINLYDLAFVGSMLLDVEV